MRVFLMAQDSRTPGPIWEAHGVLGQRQTARRGQRWSPLRDYSLAMEAAQAPLGELRDPATIPQPASNFARLCCVACRAAAAGSGVRLARYMPILFKGIERSGPDHARADGWPKRPSVRMGL